MLIKQCLQSLSNSLYGKKLLPEEVYERVGNTSLGQIERAKAILDSLEDIFLSDPNSLHKVIRIMKSEPYLTTLADQIIQSYNGKGSLN